VNIGTLMAFVIVCAAVIVMRRTHPEVHRPFRTPFMPWVPILGILMNLMMMLALHWENWLRLAGWLAVGMVIYLSYGRHHSVPREGARDGARAVGRSGAGRARS
jgi:APA family basic amino acid/polyamine antiporter